MTTTYKQWNCQVTQACKLFSYCPFKPFYQRFPDLSQFSAANVTHYSPMTQRPSGNTSCSQVMYTQPLTMLPCYVCSRNLTSPGMSYMRNHCSGLVHSKCYGLENTTDYRRMGTGNVALAVPHPLHQHHNHHQLQLLIILQFNANYINNKQAEQGEFLERHKVKVAVIHESKLSSKSPKHAELHHSRKIR